MNTRLAIRQRADLFEANISASKISLPQGKSYTILGDPAAVSRVDKMFVVKVFCKIETSSSRSYRKLSPRTFYRPD